MFPHNLTLREEDRDVGKVVLVHLYTATDIGGGTSGKERMVNMYHGWCLTLVHVIHTFTTNVRQISYIQYLTHRGRDASDIQESDLLTPTLYMYMCTLVETQGKGAVVDSLSPKWEEATVQKSTRNVQKTSQQYS